MHFSIFHMIHLEQKKSRQNTRHHYRNFTVFNRESQQNYKILEVKVGSLMAEILHQLIGRFIQLFTGLYTSKRWLFGISEPSTV